MNSIPKKSGYKITQLNEVSANNRKKLIVVHFHLVRALNSGYRSKPGLKLMKSLEDYKKVQFIGVFLIHILCSYLYNPLR